MSVETQNFILRTKIRYYYIYNVDDGKNESAMLTNGKLSDIQIQIRIPESRINYPSPCMFIAPVMDTSDSS